MVHDRNRLPELERFSPEERLEILSNARRATGWSWRLTLLLLVGTAYAGFSFWLTGEVTVRLVGISSPEVTGGIAALVGALLLLPLFVFGDRFVLHLVIRPWLRRHLVGVCSSCSYDLTGNTSGICPECGRAIDAGKLSGQ